MSERERKKELKPLNKNSTYRKQQQQKTEEKTTIGWPFFFFQSKVNRKMKQTPKKSGNWLRNACASIYDLKLDLHSNERLWLNMKYITLPVSSKYVCFCTCTIIKLLNIVHNHSDYPTIKIFAIE